MEESVCERDVHVECACEEYGGKGAGSCSAKRRNEKSGCGEESDLEQQHVASLDPRLHMIYPPPLFTIEVLSPTASRWVVVICWLALLVTLGLLVVRFFACFTSMEEYPKFCSQGITSQSGNCLEVSTINNTTTYVQVIDWEFLFQTFTYDFAPVVSNLSVSFYIVNTSAIVSLESRLEGDSPWELYTKKNFTSLILDCPPSRDPSFGCKYVTLLDTSDTTTSNYQDTISSQVHQFRVTTVFEGSLQSGVFEGLDGGHFQTQHLSGGYVLFDMTYGFGFYTILVCFLGYFLFKSIKYHNFSHWTVQHRQALLFGVGTVLAYSPFLFLVLFYQNRAFEVGFPTTMANTTGLFTTMLSLVTLMGSLAYPIGATQLPWKFYLDKLLFALVGVFVGCTYMVQAFYNRESFGDPENRDYVFMQAVGYIVWAAFVIMLIWLIILYLRLRALLRKQPYVKNRFRMLALNGLFFLGTIVLLVDLFVAISSSIFRPFVPPITLYVIANFPLYANAATCIYSMFVVYLFVPAKLTRHDFALKNETSKNSEHNQFDVRLARWILTFAGETYRINRNAKNNGLNASGYNYRLKKLIVNEESDTNVIVAEKDGFLVVAFRGTKSKKNVSTDINLKRVPIEEDWEKNTRASHSNSNSDRDVELGQAMKNDKKGFAISVTEHRVTRVHKGFWTAYCTVREEVIDEVRSYLAVHPECTSAVRVTGHSLGGALATLLTYELKKRYNIDVCLYTFGQPRVGNSTFKVRFNSLIRDAHRVCMDGDVVTGLPKWGFSHCGQRTNVDALGNRISLPSIFEQSLVVGSRRKINSHKMGSYRHAINACVKVENRLHLYHDTGLDVANSNDNIHIVFTTDRAHIEYGFRTQIPAMCMMPQMAQLDAEISSETGVGEDRISSSLSEQN
eukprot:Nk52_evm20s1916 gene=Nk52_evmTU20s1916